MLSHQYTGYRIAAALLLATSTTLAAPPTKPPDAPVVAEPEHGPDDTAFIVPDVSIPSGGFGKALSAACNAIQELPPPPRPAVERAQASKEERLRLDAGVLRAACEAVASDSLDDPLLDSLREFRDTGNLLALASALADVRRDDPNPWKTAADKLSASKGRLEGGIQGSEALSGIESRVIEGLADFLVTRTKEEAILYLQEQFTSRFCKKPDLRTILPRTCETLETLDSTVSIAAIGTALNGAARRDLEALPDGVLKLASKHDRAHYYVYEPSRLAYALIEQIARGRNPKTLALGLHQIPRRSCEKASGSAIEPATLSCREIFMAIRVASAMLYAAQMNGLDAQTPASLAEEPALVLGTLLDGEKAYLAVSAFRPLKAAELEKATRGVVDAAQLLATLQASLKSLRAQDKDDAAPTERRRRLGNAAVEILSGLSRATREWLSLTVFASAPVPAEVAAAFDITEDLTLLGQDLIAEQYGAAIADLRLLIVRLQQKELLQPTDEKSKAAIRAVVTGIGRFAPLVAEIAAASSSKDVATALEAAAAPAGSYKAKYERSSLSLNAAVGAMVGLELVRTDPPPGAVEETATSGMFAGLAALGVHVSTPFVEREAGGHWLHGGLLLSVLDLGALTTQRFESEISSTEQVDDEPNVGVAQLFAPGAYLTLGLFHSPFLLGAGFSFAPSLRTITTTDTAGVATSQDVPAVRYGTFLAMDLTLLPF
jgi:hypothetical protein